MAGVIATIRRAGHYELGQRVTMKVGDRILKGEVVAIAPLRIYFCTAGESKIMGWSPRLRKALLLFDL